MNQMASSKPISKPSKQNGKILWRKVQSIKQHFSLPSSIIYSMAKNPSTPKCYLKMVKSCKYFFEKNPILIFNSIRENGEIFCLNFNAFREIRYATDIKKLPFKIWATDEVKISRNFQSNICTHLMPKLYRCENAELSIITCKMNMEEFKMLASKFQKFYICDVKIIDYKGKVVMLEKILEVIPNVKEFKYKINDGSPEVTASTMMNIYKLQNLCNLQKLELYQMSEDWNVDDLSDFIKKHKDTKFWFHFHWNISKDYKNELDELVDDLIATKISNCIIWYNGQNHEKFRILDGRYRK